MYLLGRKFASLVWLLRFKEPEGQIARWLEELSQFDMNILYRPGEQHAHADALSRIPRHTVAFVLWMGSRIYHVKVVHIVKELRINAEHF